MLLRHTTLSGCVLDYKLKPSLSPLYHLLYVKTDWALCLLFSSTSLPSSLPHTHFTLSIITLRLERAVFCSLSGLSEKGSSLIELNPLAFEGSISPPHEGTTATVANALVEQVQGISRNIPQMFTQSTV